MRMLLLATILFSSNAFAGVPRAEILKNFETRIEGLMQEGKWQEFTKANPQLFPPLTDKMPVHTEVTKEELKLAADTFTLAICYNSALIKTDLAAMKNLFTQSEKFQSVYDLSEPVQIAGGTPDDFQGLVYKKITGFKDQNYILRYRSSMVAGLWCQRASLVEDKGDFALRDNFKCLEPVEGGVIYREISFLYPLDWYVRALGPQVRSRFQLEMGWLAKELKCVAESLKSKEWSESLAKDCWKQVKSDKAEVK